MTLGRWLIVIGVVFVGAGLLAMLGAKLGLPVSAVSPGTGDIVYHGNNTSIYIPIATCLILSVLLTLVLSLVNRLR